MTRDEIKTLKFKVAIFASLENGGHMQVRQNAQYGIVMVDVKEDYKTDWRRYFVLGEEYSKATRGGFDGEEMNFDQLVEALKDVEFVPAKPKETSHEAG